jgi:hypothetical protein
MAETTRGKIPYPVDADVPNGPEQMKKLAEQADALANRAGATNGKKFTDATTRERENAAYGLLPTAPDQISGIVIPDAQTILMIAYDALWAKTAASTCRAAIFIEKEGGAATQLQIANASKPAETTSALLEGEANMFVPLLSGPPGLVSAETASANEANLPTTGIAFANGKGSMYHELGASKRTITEGPASLAGGECLVRNLTAGNYTVTVQFKCSTGKVQVKNRTLRVWTREFV